MYSTKILDLESKKKKKTICIYFNNFVIKKYLVTNFVLFLIKYKNFTHTKCL